MTDEILGKPSTSASSQQLGEVCSVPTSQAENLDVTTVEPIEEHSSEATSHLSRANRRLGCTRRLIRGTRSTRGVLNKALQQLDSTVATFIKSQITLASESQGRRYSLEDKLMGLILHKQSERAM
ncbi:unnamed protein product [Acanthoscelides obtectus]|uniref:Uncharacterized protein n=1 Tax=Acanthoscelides obtectus TaxID=200917 RepID=A0A9P0MBK4_ACAOB|nr:unnamed protein product [Acanthoscelides obtectus]CAK1641971.1 hypothetical protein AOBTE_LOCUS12769 [Acanthoscelides obtectus]